MTLIRLGFHIVSVIRSSVSVIRSSVSVIRSSGSVILQQFFDLGETRRMCFLKRCRRAKHFHTWCRKKLFGLVGSPQE